MKTLGTFRHKVSKNLIFSFVFFFLFYLLDYSVTNLISQGNFSEEANPAVQLWWQVLGPFRHIEVLLWPLAVFVTAYVVDTKSHFLPLLWLNMLAFSHLFGVLTWFPIIDLNFLV